jgi:type I restriction enzyme, R subunit
MQKEATSRIKINKLLEKAGWRFFTDERGKANIALEMNAKITQKDVDEFGNDFEKTRNGLIDFLLLDERGFPLVVLEAKSEDKNPLDGKEQARKYAKSQNIRFILLSNGNLHYFWDLERGNPTIITSFPTVESLGHVKSFQPQPDNLVREEVKEDYIVRTQNPYYDKDPRWDDERGREEYIRENDLKFLRNYQINAILALQDSVKKGNDRFLFEMATGTGKTLVSMAVIKLFLRTRNAKRVLFLVDRLELEDQASKNFVKTLKNDYKTVVYKENRDDWKKAEIVVSTVQSLSFNNKCQKLFSPTDFDLIISDEAHRSLGGNSRAVFEYFVGYKLGLTATPKDYLKKTDPEKNNRDPREWERRQLLDTYKTFGCESGSPTFRYSLIDGVKDGYLVNPIVIDARTDITTELLSEKGYSIMVETEEGKEEEKLFFQRDFEKKFFSDETNRIFCKTFMENAFKDPISGETGKSIVFCVSQNHASRITQILNQFADVLYPGKYKSDFAVQVTSSVPDAQQFTINFSDKNNNLNGRTEFLDGYKSSKTRVCVTVGMMTTGYDCQDILNLCMMRPIFSPTDFVQIKGRGTRRYIFTHKVKDGHEIEVHQSAKNKFKLFDFFANCEYFEEKFNYDEVLKLPKRSVYAGGGGGGGVVAEEFENYDPDPLKTLTEKAIGLEGMKIDRKFFEKFEETVKEDMFIQENFEKGNFEVVEEYVKDKIFDRPEDYFNLEKLRKAVKLDRRLNIREIIEKIFGQIADFKTKDELLDEEFEKFVSIYKPDSKYVMPIKLFIKAYITDNEVRDIVEKKEYSRFATNPKITMADFKELNGWRDIVPEYVKDYVSINTYM